MTLRRDMKVIVILHVSVPVVQRCASNGDPHEGPHNVHEGVRQLTAWSQNNI